MLVQILLHQVDDLGCGVDLFSGLTDRNDEEIAVVALMPDFLRTTDLTRDVLGEDAGVNKVFIEVSEYLAMLLICLEFQRKACGYRAENGIISPVVRRPVILCLKAASAAARSSLAIFSR